MLDPVKKAAILYNYLAREGEHGLVTSLSRRFGVSRQTVYNIAAVGRKALSNHGGRPRKPPEVYELGLLRKENEKLYSELYDLERQFEKEVGGKKG